MDDRIEKYDGHMMWKILSLFFMSNVEFVMGGSVYRSGVLQNYKTVSDQYRLKFKGDTRVMSLPTPFEVVVADGVAYMDYRVGETLFKGDERLINTLKRVKKRDVSPFMDKVVVLRKSQ